MDAFKSACRQTEAEVLQIIASQFLAALILGFTNSATIQPVATLERPVFYRERAAGAAPFAETILNYKNCLPACQVPQRRAQMKPATCRRLQ